jgi:3-isopropylmalate/(R)-2-methylmalate dehydratase small subunit
LEPITSIVGRALPLERDNVDTDQIIPAEYLKRVGRTGFAEGLFSEWRKDPSFPLNDERYKGAVILLAGKGFGIGSSREHAVWALQEWGFKAVVAESFSDIFRSNAIKCGLLPVTLPPDAIRELTEIVKGDPACVLAIDVKGQTVSAKDFQVGFDLEPAAKTRFVEGLDDIGLTLRYLPEIEEYEKGRPAWLPRLA